jgi:integrase/recombinase XerD
MAKTKQKANYNRSASLLEKYPHIQRIDDEKSLYRLSQAFLAWSRERNYSGNTLRGREINLCEFIDWCVQRQIFYPTQVTKPILDRFQRRIFYKRKANGLPLSFAAQCNQLTAVRVWFMWLLKQDYVSSNPAVAMEMPRQERRLPKAVLTEREVERLLHQPDTSTTLGLRDRAILETFYSTGVRRFELANLKVTNLDLNDYTLTVRQGKGKRDRMIPIGERAAEWVKKYIYEARLELSCARDNGELFLSAYGMGLDAGSTASIVRKHIEKAGITKPGACHLLRHAMATHMLDHGAEIRFIQAMLGHTDITTTQIYTQVSMKKLREVHSNTHPSAGLKKKVQEADVEVVTLEESEALLLEMLAAESAEEEPQVH